MRKSKTRVWGPIYHLSISLNKVRKEIAEITEITCPDHKESIPWKLEEAKAFLDHAFLRCPNQTPTKLYDLRLATDSAIKYLGRCLKNPMQEFSILIILVL